MARSIRIQFYGAHYHVMARGNRRESIFVDDADRRFFLHTLSEAVGRTGWRVHAWVLMGNHYHLFIETPQANLVAGMAWLQNTVTRRFNVRHRAWGRVFGDRYKAILVEGGEAQYYQTLMDYIHLNPVRAGLVRPARGESVMNFPWSSVAGGYALPPSKRAEWLAAVDGLKSFGCPDTTWGRRRFVERLDKRARDEPMKFCGVPPMPDDADARDSHLRRGWYWGTQAFAEKVRQLAGKLLHTAKSRGYSTAAVRRAHGEAEAERLLAGGLKAAGISRKDLAKTKGADPRKAVIAKLVWERTTVSQGWLAKRLHMISAANAGMVVRREIPRKKLSTLPKALLDWEIRERKSA